MLRVEHVLLSVPNTNKYKNNKSITCSLFIEKKVKVNFQPKANMFNSSIGNQTA